VRFDHEYYRDTHLPLIKTRMGAGLKYYAIDRGLTDDSGRAMTRRFVRGWPCAAAAALVLGFAMPSLAIDARTVLAKAEEVSGARNAFTPEGDRDAGRYHLMDVRVDSPASWRIAQATGASDGHASVAGVEDRPHEVSTSELNKQLANPVTSLWSLQFQFNNFRLETGEWNNNLLFQPVLPVSLTKHLNLITRPVIPLYDVVPHETAPGEFEQTVGFGDITLVELLSPANSGHWILGAGPTFIFPTATSDFTGQGKWQAGPAFVVGYLTDKFFVGAFPQQWWSFAGDSSRPDTSHLNLQPIATWFLGEGWSVGYSGNILADWKASSGDRWTVPIGVSVGKVLKFGRLPVKVQLAGQYIPIRPDNGPEWNIQLQLTPVIPKLIKEPLFR
jgi:hypothetical protein